MALPLASSIDFAQRLLDAIDLSQGSTSWRPAGSCDYRHARAIQVPRNRACRHPNVHGQPCFSRRMEVIRRGTEECFAAGCIPCGSMRVS